MMNAGSHFGEAKKSKCPAGTKRMVKATPQANHKALTQFSGCLFVNGCLQDNAVAMRKRVGSLKTEFCEVKMAWVVLRFMFLMD